MGRSGLAAVLITDLVGSTELMARLGDAAFDAVRAEHFEQLRHTLGVHGGTEVKNTGDGVLAVFSSAVEAVAAAVVMQQEAHRPSQGRLGELVERVGRVASRPDPEPLRLVSFGLALAELGRTAEAAAVLDDLSPGDFAAFPTNFCWLHGLSMAAEICAATGQEHHTVVLYGHLVPHCGLIGSGGGSVSPAVDHCLGLLATTLGRHDEADAHFAAAAGIHHRLGAPTFLARTHLEWATMLLRRRRPGDDERAQELLTQALSVAVDLGLGTVERRARALL